MESSDVQCLKGLQSDMQNVVRSLSSAQRKNILCTERKHLNTAPKAALSHPVLWSSGKHFFSSLFGSVRMSIDLILVGKMHLHGCFVLQGH